MKNRKQEYSIPLVNLVDSVTSIKTAVLVIKKTDMTNMLKNRYTFDLLFIGLYIQNHQNIGPYIQNLRQQKRTRKDPFYLGWLDFLFLSEIHFIAKKTLAS